MNGNRTRTLAAAPPGACVGNHSQANSGEIDLSADKTIATSFKTGGSSTDRFKLDSAVVQFDAWAIIATVRVYNDSGGSPGTQVGGDLRRYRGSSNEGNTTYSGPVPGITLNGDTTYWLVVIMPADTDVRVTTSDAQTGSTGWEIGNNTVGLSGSTWSQQSASAIRFAINATSTCRTRLRPRSVRQR